MTDSTTFFEEHLGSRRTMVILRGYSTEKTLELCRRASDLGVGLIEVPVQTPDAYPAFRAAADWGTDAGISIGAGTVTSVPVLRLVHEWGANFTVAPGLDHDVVRASSALGLPHLPGVATASEIQQAVGAGLTWLKAFPASVLGAEWVKAMLGPFPGVRFVMTGGMDAATAPAFFDAGAAAVSLGSSFAGDDANVIAALGTTGAQGGRAR